MAGKDLHEYRVKPSRTYGATRRVVLAAILHDMGLSPQKKSRLQMTYNDFTVVCYNPQKLRFNVNTIISALQTIHGRANSIEIIEC